MTEKFCCCSLKTGTLIYGYILLAFAIYTLVQNCIALSYGENGSQYSIFFTPLNVVSVVFLIYGATKAKKIFVFIFLIWNAIGLVITSVVIIIVGIQVPLVLVGLPMIAGFAYLWYNVLKYYKLLSEKEMQNGRLHGDIEGNMSDQPPAHNYK